MCIINLCKICKKIESLFCSGLNNTGEILLELGNHYQYNEKILFNSH